MKNIKEMKKKAIDNLDIDIGLLLLQNRVNKDTITRETILKEKLNLLYNMDIINFQTYDIYHSIIDSLKGD